MNYGNFTTYANNAEDAGNKRLSKRIRVEGRICAALVDALLAKGCAVSIFDGEEWAIKRSTEKTAIMAELFATDQDEIIARDAEGVKLGWWLLVYGNDGYDVVSDYTANDFCEAIMAEIQPVIDRAEEAMA